MESNYGAESSERRRRAGEGGAFLLAQLGARATQRFAERIAVLGLTPPQAGLLRVITREPGRSQQALAQQLGIPPTRVVSLVDGLESRGVVERQRNAADRRLYAVYLTEPGHRLMRELGTVAVEHEAATLAALDADERATLFELLTRIADEHGLAEGVHPGYRDLGADRGAALGDKS